MSVHRRSVCLGMGMAMAVGLAALSTGARAQEGSARANAGAGSPARAAIEAEFDRGLRALEKERIKKLDQLAQSQQGDEASETYEALFRFALSTQNYGDAEPAAERILNQGGQTPVVLYLAQVINIMAEADRGAYEESLNSLLQSIRGAAGAPNAEAKARDAAIPVEARLEILEAYYQRLMHANQIEIARKAFKAIEEAARASGTTQVVSYTANRLRQLDLIGKPAPDFTAMDQDGKAIKLSDFRGKVVLLVFWATWCVPSDPQAHWVEDLYGRYRGEGFRVITVNLDLHQEDGLTMETVAPNIRRFLIDHNVTWPDVVDKPGEQSIATTFAITDIPASVLIGADGKVLDLDLSRADAEKEIQNALAAARSGSK